MGANECVARLFDNRPVTCAVNPSVGREARWGSGTLRPVAPGEAKNIPRRGGGLAGMKTAAVAGSAAIGSRCWSARTASAAI